MMEQPFFFRQWLQHAEKILDIYLSRRQNEPFHLFTKDYFRQNKNLGKRDRNFILELCYGFFRLGKTTPELPMETRMLLGAKMQKQPENFLALINAALNDQNYFNEYSDLTDNTHFTKQQINFRRENPYLEFHLSGNLNPEFLHNNLLKPGAVFIRLRAGQTNKIIGELNQQQINFQEINTTCLKIENGKALTELNAFKNGWFEIQDIASQKTGELMQVNNGENWWDCCAASGGKSLMVLEKNQDINLVASDIRPAILENYKTRIRRSFPKRNPVTMVVDLTVEDLRHRQFEKIICDVPCSGSGTWHRTPESAYFFSSEQLESFTKKQKIILSNALQSLQPGGSLYYITCSAFKQENENIIEEIAQSEKIEISQSTVIDYSDAGGDIMFFAELKKSLG